METELGQIVMIMGVVAMLMELPVKFGLKTALPKLFNSIPYLPDFPPEETVKWSFRGLAIAIGIGLAFTVFNDISYFGMFDRVPVDQNMVYLDHIIVGFLAGLTEKGAHDLLQASKRFFEFMGKVGGQVPIQS